MTHKERENFYRNSTLIVDHANESFTGLLQHDLTKQGLTLSQFIQAKQHEVYHLCYNIHPCCMCPPGSRAPVFRHNNRILNPAQLDILLDTTAKIPGHHSNSQTKHCCCPANPNITYNQLDLTLTRCLLLNFTTVIPDGSPERLAVDKLIRFRNESYGHATEGKISDHDYQINKAQIENSIMILAQAQGRESEFKQKLSDAAVRTLDETILRQYQTKMMENVEMMQTLKNIESAVGVQSLPDCLTKDLRDVTVTEGCDTHFEIRTKERGMCSLWLRDEVEIVRSQKFIPGESGKIHSLDIRNTSLSDKGQYTVRIKDRHVLLERQAHLYVEEYFTMNLQSVECIEGETAKFTCEVKEDSLPARWNKNKNGICLENDGKYEILHSGKFHRLSIKNCDLHDTANYTVSINNRVRETSLVVIEYFTKSLYTKNCIQGENVHFECEVLDDNKTSVWFKDGTEMNTSDRHQVERHGKLHRLVVKNTRLGDQGEYSVKIKNCVRSSKLSVLGSRDDLFQQKCLVCDKEPSVSWCHACQRTLCEDCNNQHTKSKDTKYHIVHHIQDMYSLDYTFKVNIEFINDIKVLNDDVLIISDFRAKQLITGLQEHTIPLRKKPCYIAVVDNNTVAVTLNKSILIPTNIVIVDVRQKKVMQHINIDVACYGIMYRENQLFVGCRDSKIRVFNMSGEVAHTIPVSVIPNYICGGEAGRIYYTTKSNSTLYCIDKDGNIVFTFTDPNMVGPEGITRDDEGHVFVMCRDSNKGLRISPDGKQCQVIITHIPWSEWSPYICYNSLSKSVVIGRHDNIYVFKKCK